MEYGEISNSLRTQFINNKTFEIDKFSSTIFEKIFNELFLNKCNKENKNYYSWLNMNIKNYLTHETNIDPYKLTSSNKEFLYANLFLTHGEYSDYDRFADWLNFLIREDKIPPNDLITVTNRKLIGCLVLNNINHKFDSAIKYYMDQKPKSLFFIGHDAETINLVINQNDHREPFINFLIKHNLLLTAQNIRFNHMEDEHLNIIIEKKLISLDNENSWHNIYAQKLKNKKQDEQNLIINSFIEMGMSPINLPVSHCLLRSSFSDFTHHTYSRTLFNFETTLFNKYFNHQTEFLDNNKYEVSLKMVEWPDEDDFKIPFFKHFINFLNNNNIYLDNDKLYDFLGDRIKAYTDDEFRPYLDIVVNNEQNILITSLNQNKINIKKRL